MVAGLVDVGDHQRARRIDIQDHTTPRRLLHGDPPKSTVIPNRALIGGAKSRGWL